LCEKIEGTPTLDFLILQFSQATDTMERLFDSGGPKGRREEGSDASAGRRALNADIAQPLGGDAHMVCSKTVEIRVAARWKEKEALFHSLITDNQIR
jgi:hypothetical protein